MAAAHRRVSVCECGPETSCYRCLRGFRNQWRHDQLRRGEVATLLDRLLGAGSARVGDGGGWRRLDAVPDLCGLDGQVVRATVGTRPLVGTLWVEADEDVPVRLLLETDGEVLELKPDELQIEAVKA